MYISGALLSVFLYLICRELLSVNYKNKNIELPLLERQNSISIGVFENRIIYHNFNKFPHMIVAGTTGYGKTNFLKCLISQVNGEVVLIDLKGGFDYNNVSATDIYEARDQLKYVTDKMKQRRKSHIYVVVDEAGELYPPDFLDKEGKSVYLECLHYVSEIARLGRAFNVHLIYATQYPTSDIVPRQIKQCAETRLVFRLPTEIASRVALDESGAELLESGNYGLGLYKTDKSLECKTFKFVERVGWDEKVRVEKAEGKGNSFIIE